MKTLHRALVGVYSQLDPHLLAHKRVAKALYRLSDVHGISPVYHYSDLNEEGLVVSYSLRTQLEPDELKEKLKSIEDGTQINKALLHLLAFDDFIIRKPDYVVPWVELHNTKKWSVPAAYLWPDYIHPIESKDIKTISEALQTGEHVSFYSQSKSLLDFLNIDN